MRQKIGIVSKASDFVFDLFKRRLSEHLLYHTFDHTVTVADTARKIGKEMKLSEEGIEVVTLAGLFHDTGYTEVYTGHEEMSIRIAREFLMQEQYPEEKIELIIGCIRATKIPQQPKNLLEEVVADADLSGLGKKSFYEKSELLYIEWEKELDKKYTESEWIQQNIDLLTHHQFFTQSAKRLFGNGQGENLLLLQKKLHKLNSSSKKRKQKGEADHTLFPFSQKEEAHSETSTQMLFKLVSNTLMMENLSADHKALIMIFANAILITMSFAGITIGKLNGVIALNIEVPLSIFLFFSVITIFFSVLSMRQHIRFKYSDDQKKRSPLFGIFSAMSYDYFDSRMKEMNTDTDFLLYSTMTREYFDQRFIVARKYRFLYLGYTVFMYGLCITLLVFLTLFFFPI